MTEREVAALALVLLPLGVTLMEVLVAGNVSPTSSPRNAKLEGQDNSDNRVAMTHPRDMSWASSGRTGPPPVSDLPGRRIPGKHA